MQDVGVRYYTYISTLLYAMETASDHGIEFIVADRPNPITCTDCRGTCVDKRDVNHSLAYIRYQSVTALTIGELATLLKSEPRAIVSVKGRVDARIRTLDVVQ